MHRNLPRGVVGAPRVVHWRESWKARRYVGGGRLGRVVNKDVDDEAGMVFLGFLLHTT